MSGALQKIDKSILETAREDLSSAENLVIILCILTGEVGLPSEKYIDFFYYSLLDSSLGLNRHGGGSKEKFNTALQELLDSEHCVETRGGIQFYEEMFTADRDAKARMRKVDTFKDALKELADKCEQSEDKCATVEDFNRNEPDDMSVMQYIKHSFALDVKTRGCEGTVVYNAANGTCRVLKRSTLAHIAGNVADGRYCENLQSDRDNNSDKILNLAVLSDIYLPSMTRCLDFIGGAQSYLKWTKVHNSSGLDLGSIVSSKSLYEMYIASGKSVEGLNIPEEKQFTQEEEVKADDACNSVKNVAKLPDYEYSVGDTLIIKGEAYCGKIEYTGSSWKILAGSICSGKTKDLSDEDIKTLVMLERTGKWTRNGRIFVTDVDAGTFEEAHFMLAHQRDETIDTFVYDYTETLQSLVSVLTDSTFIRAALSNGKSKKYSELFTIKVGM